MKKRHDPSEYQDYPLQAKRAGNLQIKGMKKFYPPVYGVNLGSVTLSATNHQLSCNQAWNWAEEFFCAILSKKYLDTFLVFSAIFVGRQG
jgi:hypothetical protein